MAPDRLRRQRAPLEMDAWLEGQRDTGEAGLECFGRQPPATNRRVNDVYAPG